MEDDRVYRVYADGVFDCFHLGHANVLKQAKQCLPGKKVHLIAGVCKQTDVEKFKGSCINTEHERVELVRSCKWVDEVYEGAPWIIDEKFLTDNNIDFVAHDAEPYVTADTNDAYALPKRLGKFKETQRTAGISTSDLVTRIISDRDKYIARNLKRGVSRESLNLSLIEYWIFIIKQKFCPRRAPATTKKA